MGFFDRFQKKPSPKSEDAFYGGKGEFDDTGGSDYYKDDDTLQNLAPKEHNQAFTWWEWTIFVVEALLILYTLLAFLQLAPLF